MTRPRSVFESMANAFRKARLSLGPRFTPTNSGPLPSEVDAMRGVPRDVELEDDIADALEVEARAAAANAPPPRPRPRQRRGTTDDEEGDRK